MKKEDKKIVKEVEIDEYKITKFDDESILFSSNEGVNTIEYNARYDEIYMMLDVLLSSILKQRGKDNDV